MSFRWATATLACAVTVLAAGVPPHVAEETGPPQLPTTFVASWTFTSVQPPLQAQQTGWLGSIGDSFFQWRVNTELPGDTGPFNRSEVYVRYTNGTVVQGGFWDMSSYNGGSSASSSVACANAVTAVGLGGLRLDWLMDPATLYYGVEVVDGVNCSRWHLQFGSCYDLWVSAGKGCGTPQHTYDYHAFRELTPGEQRSPTLFGLPAACSPSVVKPSAGPSPSASPQPGHSSVRPSWLIYGASVAAVAVLAVVLTTVYFMNRKQRKPPSEYDSLLDVLH